MLTVYCDMDDTLTDFVGKALTIYKGDPNKKNRFTEIMEEFVDKNYFADLKWTPNGMKLAIELEDLERVGLIHVELLSSTGRKVLPADYIQRIIEQKTAWLNRYQIGWKLNIVSTTETQKDYEAKATFAKSNTVLIDDHKENCENFEKAGGLAIHYDGDVKRIRKVLVTMIADHNNINSR